MWDIISTIVTGLIVGALARFFLRGNQNIGMLWTIILGIVGAFVGSFIAGALGVAQTGGIDWIRWILMIVAAMVAVSIYIGVTRGSSRQVSR
ncbi:GlsB/YeaQ/YmgE family stress response membrane protein [Nigerium massiliense]|uniref:GlsB/YeaQ/YmgE family stress response membrane protein n=1 Tax=Nigerium massiliense TaxID=1522317 RepID=UPI00058E39B4|nr:GlsB/YeaQ/YmgE family stress response membrane protein [Nigerium massiliense]